MLTSSLLLTLYKFDKLCWFPFSTILHKISRDQFTKSRKVGLFMESLMPDFFSFLTFLPNFYFWKRDWTLPKNFLIFNVLENH